MTSTDPTGDVAAGFEPVFETFAAVPCGEGGAAACVYVGGECVLDCWAGLAAPRRPWRRDTRAALFSATKVLTAAVAMLVSDRGHLDPDARAADYWPALGADGKERLLVRHVLDHSAGVLSFPGYAELLGWDGTGWDATAEIADRLTRAQPVWEPGTRHGYHALTFGWLIGELVRRVDGRTLGAVLADDVAVPLGSDVLIGTPPADQRLMAQVHAPPVPTTGPGAAAWRSWQDPTTLGGQAFLAGPDGSLMSRAPDLAGAPTFLAAEVPAGNATGSARGLARVCAALAAPGPPGGRSLWSADVVDDWRRERTAGRDAVLGFPTRWGLGFELPVAGRVAGSVTPLATSPDAFGHGGFGGQLALADPTLDVAVGFVRSHLEGGWVSAAKLVEAVRRCVC